MVMSTINNSSLEEIREPASKASELVLLVTPTQRLFKGLYTGFLGFLANELACLSASTWKLIQIEKRFWGLPLYVCAGAWSFRVWNMIFQLFFFLQSCIFSPCSFSRPLPLFFLLSHLNRFLLKLETRTGFSQIFRKIQSFITLLHPRWIKFYRNRW